MVNIRYLNDVTLWSVLKYDIYDFIFIFATKIENSHHNVIIYFTSWNIFVDKSTYLVNVIFHIFMVIMAKAFLAC